MIKEELGPHWAHICVDMQLLFAPGEDWGLAWLPKVVPRIASLCAVDPSRTVFSPASSRHGGRERGRGLAQLLLPLGKSHLGGRWPAADRVGSRAIGIRAARGCDRQAGLLALDRLGSSGALGGAGGRYSVGDRRRDRHVRTVHHSWRDRLGLPDGAGCRRRMKRFRRGAQRHAQPVRQALQPACRDGGDRRARRSPVGVSASCARLNGYGISPRSCWRAATNSRIAPARSA